MPRRITGLWLGLAISSISLLLFDALFGGALNAFVSVLFSLLYWRRCLPAWWPLADMPYLFLVVFFTGQSAFYPTAGRLLAEKIAGCKGQTTGKPTRWLKLRHRLDRETGRSNEAKGCAILPHLLNIKQSEKDLAKIITVSSPTL